jgi:LysM repeat protein
MHKVSVEELQKFNHIENERKLQIGQTIMIPPSSAASSPTPGG